MIVAVVVFDAGAIDDTKEEIDDINGASTENGHAADNNPIEMGNAFKKPVKNVVVGVDIDFGPLDLCGFGNYLVSKKGLARRLFSEHIAETTLESALEIFLEFVDVIFSVNMPEK